MSGLAHGGHGPVLTMSVMGVSALIVGSLVSPVAGLVPMFGILSLMSAAFLANFWRDPDRPIPSSPGLLVSPADGHVMFVQRERAIARRPSRIEFEKTELQAEPSSGDWHPAPLEDPLSFETEQRFEPVPVGDEQSTDVIRVAIFMSPLDVHVNRAPAAGVIERMELRTGKGLRRGPHRFAFKKESQYNERVRTVFQLDDGCRIEMMQIAGFLARTVVPYLPEGAQVRRGQRVGMIRLGSRVDVRAPAEQYSTQLVSAEENHPSYPKGMFVQAGTTVLFHPLSSEEEA